ncbi:hypothetical protein ACVIIV_002982 [Bradyrhizobium sp. USDA 4354]
MAAPLLAETRQRFQEQLASKDAELARKVEALRLEREQLTREREQLEDRVVQRLAIERAQLASSEGRKAREAAEALACNLLLLKATGSDAKLAVPRSHDFLYQGNATANPVYGQHFLTAIDLMASCGLIEEDRRGYRISERTKMPSLIQPADSLGEHLPLPTRRTIAEDGCCSIHRS